MNSKQQTQTNKTYNDNNDILADDKYIFCGRGHASSKRSGNQKFAKVIQANVNDYINAETRIAKVVVVASVANIFRENGMKFVTFDAATNSYVELSSERVHTKCSHAIRFQIRQNEKYNNKNFVMLPGGQKRRAATNTLRTGSIRGSGHGGGKIKKRSTSTTSSGKKGMSADDAEFNAWWAKKKNACFDMMLWSAAPVPISELDVEDILDVSETIFELGAKIDETSHRTGTTTTASTSTRSNEENDWDFVIQQLLEKEDVLATPPPISPFGEMEFPMLEQIQFARTMSTEIVSKEPSSLVVFPLSLPTSSSMQAELAPLSFDSDAKLA